MVEAVPPWWHESRSVVEFVACSLPGAPQLSVVFLGRPIVTATAGRIHIAAAPGSPRFSLPENVDPHLFPAPFAQCLRVPRHKEPGAWAYRLGTPFGWLQKEPAL